MGGPRPPGDAPHAVSCRPRCGHSPNVILPLCSWSTARKRRSTGSSATPEAVLRMVDRASSSTLPSSGDPYICRAGAGVTWAPPPARAARLGSPGCARLSRRPTPPQGHPGECRPPERPPALPPRSGSRGGVCPPGHGRPLCAGPGTWGPRGLLAHCGRWATTLPASRETTLLSDGLFSGQQVTEASPEGSQGICKEPGTPSRACPSGGRAVRHGAGCPGCVPVSGLTWGPSGESWGAWGTESPAGASGRGKAARCPSQVRLLDSGMRLARGGWARFHTVAGTSSRDHSVWANGHAYHVTRDS